MCPTACLLLPTILAALIKDITSIPSLALLCLEQCGCSRTMCAQAMDFIEIIKTCTPACLYIVCFKLCIKSKHAESWHRRWDPNAGYSEIQSLQRQHETGKEIVAPGTVKPLLH